MGLIDFDYEAIWDLDFDYEATRGHRFQYKLVMQILIKFQIKRINRRQERGPKHWQLPPNLSPEMESPPPD